MGLFGNLMNNYMYGKAGKGDYRVEDMPKNRAELFGAVLKVRWASLFGVNLLYMIPWIPTLIWTIVNMAVLFSDQAAQPGTIQSVFSTYLLLLFPCILITGPFTAGITFVCRNWARDEHSFVLSDFWDAVKANWKQALPISAISGLCPVLLYFSYMFYGSMGAQNPLFYIPMCLVFVVTTLWKLSEMVMYTMMVTYSLKLRDIIRNSLLLTCGRLPLAVGIKLLTWVVPAILIGLALIAQDITMYVLLAALLIYVLWLPAFNRLLICSYANASCEKYLNTKIDGAKTNIGLRPEDWDDTEYIPQDDEDA